LKISTILSNYLAFLQNLKKRKEDKDNIYQTEKVGSYHLPPPESVLPTFNSDIHVRNVVISGSKLLQEGKDFGMGVTKKVIVKDLLQALHDDPHHRHKPIVYQLSN